MIMNDFVDVWFEGAKIAHYAKKQGSSTFFYVSFVVTWFFLRQVYCPLVLQWSCRRAPPQPAQSQPAPRRTIGASLSKSNVPTARPPVC